MPGQVENPEDWFSHNEAHISFFVGKPGSGFLTRLNLNSYRETELMIKKEEALLYPPQNGVLGGYTVFSLSEIPKFRNSEIP